MKILFSPYFDSPVHLNENLPENRKWFNRCLAGPERLLQIFETYLGLAGKYPPAHERTLTYRNALESILPENPFYLQSFNADPVKTASLLLQWRDELLIGGADLEKGIDLPPRIKDLQKAEIILRKNDFFSYAGEADRWNRVINKIRAEKGLTEINILIHYPYDLLVSWQKRLINILREHPSVTIEKLAIEPAEIDQDTDLGKLKKSFLDGENVKAEFSGDGTFLILRTIDPIEGSKILSHYLMSNNIGTSSAIVAKSGSNLAAGSLTAHNIPSAAIKSEIPEDPLLQILKLLPSCVYAPLDIRKFTELLMFPEPPFNRYLARNFARLMSNVPGRMAEAWESIKKEWKKKQKDPDKAEKQLEVIRFYLEEPLLQEDDKSAKKIKERIISLLNKTAANAAGKAQLAIDRDPELSDSFLKLNKACHDLILSFERLDQDKIITKLVFEQLVREVATSAGKDIKEQEKDSVDIVSNGSVLISPAEQVIVWNCIKEEKAGKITWLPNETNWLRKMKIAFEDPEEVYKQRFFNDTNIICQTSERLILIVPDSINGEPAETSNLYNRIIAIARNINPVELRFPDAQDQIAELMNIKLNKLPVIKIPSEPPAYWNIQKNEKIQKRKYESYSSLSDLLYFPYAWFLNYQAKIRPSAMISLSSNMVALQGTLAHRIIEEVINETENPFYIQEHELLNKINFHYDQILEKEGALFLLPDQKKHNSHFRYILQKSIPAFLKECRINGWKRIKMETEIEKDVEGFNLKSRLDALLEKDNDSAVVDIKYYCSQNRKEEMKNDRDIQLIIYSGLAAVNGSFPKSAYYFVKDMHFMAKHRGAFKNSVIEGDLKEDAEQINNSVFEKIIRTAAYRWEEIKEGKLEVGEDMDVLNLDISGQAGLLTLPVTNRKKSLRPFNDYENLLRVK